MSLTSKDHVPEINYFDTDTQLGDIVKSIRLGKLSSTIFKRHDGLKGDIGYVLGWYPDEHKKNYSDIDQYKILVKLRSLVSSKVDHYVQISELVTWFDERLVEVAIRGGNHLLKTNRDNPVILSDIAAIDKLTLQRPNTTPQPGSSKILLDGQEEYHELISEEARYVEQLNNSLKNLFYKYYGIDRSIDSHSTV